jgi:hypothetical protein
LRIETHRKSKIVLTFEAKTSAQETNIPLAAGGGGGGGGGVGAYGAGGVG